MISVLTPSIRPGYLDLTQKALEAQTFTDFEWLVEIGLPSRGFTLPSDFNKMLRRAKGDIIVILQDCIDISPNALESISKLDHTRTAYTYAVSKAGKWDWRHFPADPLTPNHWEIDFGSAPLSLFKDVGGFDEEFCQGWSWENVEIAWRAEAAGYIFRCSPVAYGEALDHDYLTPHPFRNRLPNNDQRANETRFRAKRGDFKLSYL